MKEKKLAIASDHAGFALKNILIDFLIANNYEVKDFGAHSESSCDYPDYAHPLAEAVANGEVSFGIAICGSGNGVNITVNKHQKIRGALCWNEEIAKLARAHNDANILSLPARFISPIEAILILKTFLNTQFEGDRHIKRIEKIPIRFL